MTRRRFFRITNLTLLILCVAVWTMSYMYRTQASLMRPSGWYNVTLGYGNLMLRHVRGVPKENGLRLVHDRTNLRQLTARLVLGFSFDRSNNWVAIAIPMWFPTLLLTALAAWAWRKRRSEGERGFAAEGVGEATGRPPP